MWPLHVVVLLPGGDDLTRMLQTGKPVQVEAFIAELPIETLQMPILRGFARFDKV